MSENNLEIIGVSHLDDRHPDAGTGHADAGAGETLPETLTEIKLAAIWQTALPGIPVFRESNFIAIGGDSLSLAQVIVEVEETYAVSLEVEAVANNLALKDMAAMIDQLSKKGAG